MKLVKARVTNFRSVEDSGEFEVGNVLCLVGKNEAGKSAILQALAGLNPHPSTPIVFDRERDYPRRFLAEYDTRHEGKEACVVWSQWQLSEGQKTAITDEFGEGVIEGDHISLSRSYNETVEWSVPVNFKVSVQNLIDRERMNAAEKQQLAAANTSDELRKILEAIPERTEKQNKLLTLLNSYPGKNVLGKIIKTLSVGLPHFMYFAHYDRMAGQLRIDTVNARRRGEQSPSLETSELVFMDFLEYAGTSLSEIVEAKTYEGLNAQCESASNRITEQLLEYWTQNPNLEIEVRVTKAEPNDPAPFNSGVVARARVRNNLHKVTVPFSERSAGFIWFFSFLVKFAQVRKDGGGLLLLLDEPGLTLHGKAQADLLRYFDERLAPHHQVIFSTHSPFMVPADNLPSVRIVEDKLSQPKPGRWITEGTKVRSDTLATDRDTLFPLQGALGYEVTQSLFIGKLTLLVEGPGDVLGLQALSSAIVRKGGTGIDRRWTLCPAGGIDKIQPFISLFSGAKLNIAALTDYARSDRKKIEAIRQNRVMEGERFLTYAGVLGLEEADLEDVFHPALYLAIVNSAYELKGKNELNLEKLNEVKIETGRLVKKVEALFRTLPPDVAEFDHYTPMDWLIRNSALLDGKAPGVQETLQNADKIMSALNAVLAGNID